MLVVIPVTTIMVMICFIIYCRKILKEEIKCRYCGLGVNGMSHDCLKQSD